MLLKARMSVGYLNPLGSSRHSPSRVPPLLFPSMLRGRAGARPTRANGARLCSRSEAPRPLVSRPLVTIFAR